MAKKSIYTNVSKPQKNNAKTVAIVLGVISALLLIFIAWCGFAFSGDGVYKNSAYDISMLKIELDEKEAQINSLKEQIVRLEEQKKQLENNALLQMPTTTLPPTPTPSATF